jgi:hypothetical protein
MKHDNPLGSPLLALAHYQTLLKTIVQAPIHVFPSLIDDIHIMGPMNKIIFTFDHLLTQLALIEFKVKVSKCKFWSPNNFSSIEIPRYTTFWSQMAYAFWVCQWVLRTLSCIFWMMFFLMMWRILMIFLSCETHKLHSTFCLHVSFINLFISLGDYLILLPSCLFW